MKWAIKDIIKWVKHAGAEQCQAGFNAELAFWDRYPGADMTKVQNI